MDNEKNLKIEGLRGKEGEFGNESSSRARNRTVMLTPEITGQVRARLAQEVQDPRGAGVSDRGVGDSHDFDAPLSGAYDPSSRQQPSAGAAGGGYVPVDYVPQYAAPQQQVARPVASQRSNDGIVWTKETPVVGFLVSYDGQQNGEVYVLRSGRIMITSQSGEGNALVLNDDSVSPMHAIMRISAGGEIQVLDQLSEFGTRIKRFGSEEEEQLSGEKASVEHGDIIKFGNRSFHVCIVARAESA